MKYKNDIYINSTKYSATPNDASMKPETPKFFNLNVSKHSEIITIPFLQQMHLVNLQKIEKFDSAIETQQTYWVITLTFILITIVIFIIARRFNKRVINTTPAIEDFNVNNAVNAILKQIESNMKQIRDVPV